MARKDHSLTQQSNDGTESPLFDRQKKQNKHKQKQQKNMIARQVHPLTNKTKKR